MGSCPSTGLRAPGLRAVAAAAAEAPTLGDALDALRRELPPAYATTVPLDARLLAAVARITDSGGTAPLEAIAKGRRRLPRWLERHFQAAVGVTPKRLARLVRFRRAVATLEADGSEGGAAVALDHGYYDQAHFITEFRAFAGDAPRRFVHARLAELTRFFVDRGLTPDRSVGFFKIASRGSPTLVRMRNAMDGDDEPDGADRRGGLGARDGGGGGVAGVGAGRAAALVRRLLVGVEGRRAVHRAVGRRRRGDGYRDVSHAEGRPAQRLRVPARGAEGRRGCLRRAARRRGATEFTATEQSSTAIGFANPAHDFPKRVGYRLVDATHLTA